MALGPSGPASAAPSGLVAAYAFDEGSGTTVADASGNGHNGTIANATWAAAGKYGKALQFNGTNAIVSIPDAGDLHLTTGVTLEAWVNPSTISSAWRDVVYKANDNYYLEASSTNASKPDAGVIAGGSYGDAFGSAALPASTWTFLTETYDGSNVRLYVNGTQVAATAHTGTLTASSNPLTIGGDNIYGQYFAGMIDNVRVYNVALTPAQIQTDQTTAVSPPGPDTTPPTQPGTLTATAISAGEIDLAWGASTDTVGVTGYQLERCQRYRLHHLRADRDTTPRPATTTPPSTPPPATATASAPPTPPTTSAPTPTPPAPRPRRPTRRRPRSRAR